MSALAGLVLLGSCTEGVNPAGPANEGKVRLGLRAEYAVASASQAPIIEIRTTVEVLPSGPVHGPFKTPVNPDDAQWVVPVEFPASGPVSVTVLVELISSANGVETVEYSGRVGPLTVSPGPNPTSQTIQVFPGPIENLNLTDVVITGPSSVPEGDNVQLGLQGTPAPANPQALWRTLTPTLATVNATGMVTALLPGTARIVAAAGLRADTFSLTITRKANRVVIAPATQTLNSFGVEAVYTARVLDARSEEIPGIALVWSITPTTVATMTSPGHFRSNANGQATVTATVQGGTLAGTAQLIVEQRVAQVLVTPPSAVLTRIGETTQFAANARDANNVQVTTTFVWTSTDSTVARVDNTGRVTAQRAGRTTIRATAGGVTGSAELVVSPRTVARVDVTPSSHTFPEVGATHQFTAVARDSQGVAIPNLPVQWASLNTAVVAIDSLGVAHAIGGGNTQLRATIGGVNGFAQVHVTEVGTGGIHGVVRNARDASPIAGAQVRLNGGSGGTMQTNASGAYHFDQLLPGTYTVEGAAAGFIAGGITVEVGTDVETDQDIVLSPVGVAGEFRIVLTWGELPGDLDSHLFVGSGEPGHVFYAAPGDSLGFPFAVLDTDDTDSFGPETITIVQLLSDSTYTYKVNDFDNGGTSGSTALSQSGARVQVYSGNAQIADFAVPGGAGTLWTVFQIVNGSIVPVNTMSDDSPEPNALTTPAQKLRAPANKKLSHVRTSR